MLRFGTFVLICGAAALAIGGLPKGGGETRTPSSPAPVSAPTYLVLASPSEPAARSNPDPPKLASLPVEAPAPTVRPLAVAPAFEAPTTTSQAEAPLSLTVTLSKAALKKSPSTKAKRVGEVRRGDVVVERGRSGSWREVELSDGRSGWIRGSAFASAVEKSTPPARPAPELEQVETPSPARGAAALAMAALIVQQSRASYGGSCGCPDDRDRAGRRCGGRSAYSRAGGRSLFCYAEDVPAALVAKRMARK